MKIKLPTAITTRAGNLSLVAQKNSPKLLFSAGIVLFGATVVSAANATLKLDSVLYDVKADHRAITESADASPEKWSQKEIARLHTYVSAKGILSITKLYLPTISLGVAAVGCLTVSHNQLTRRNAGLSAALAATERALDRYRSRIREEFGEEKEMKLWRGEGKVDVEEIGEDGEPTGKKTKKKVGGGYSPYARAWGRDTSGEWSPDAPYNMAKLRSVQELGTLMLNDKGHLFLNEIFDELGLERTPAGAVVGWLTQKNGGADGYVNFGIFQAGDEVAFLDFLTGDEEHIWLDFNVDGEIWKDI